MTDSPSFWKGEVFISDGHAWGTDDDLEAVYLGKATEVLPILDGAPMPEEFKGARRRILEGILEEKRIDRINDPTSGPSVRRRRSMLPAARQQRAIGNLA